MLNEGGGAFVQRAARQRFRNGEMDNMPHTFKAGESVIFILNDCKDMTIIMTAGVIIHSVLRDWANGMISG